jgi:putative ABC transport system permease protein
LNKEIIFANLAHRPVRTAVSIVAVSIEVALILLIVGLVTGIKVDIGERAQGVGAEIMLQAPGSSVFLGLNSSVMPIAIGERLEEVEGIESVAPVVTQFNSQGGLDIVFGIDEDSFGALGGGFSFIDGRIFQSSDEIVIDDLYAEAKKIGVGDEISILNHRFEVSGVVENGKGARLYMDLATAQEMMGAPDRASLFYIKLDDPNDTYAIVDQLEALLPTYPAIPVRDMVSLMSNTTVPALDAFLTVVLSLAVSIGVLVIFLSMYTTISERTREIGVLRSLGASKGFVVRMILTETLWLCLVGIFFGIGLSFVIANAVQFLYATLAIVIPPGWIFQAIALALLSGILGAIYPSLRAASQDPVEALAYE